MTWGTSFFVSRSKAVKYYSQTEDDPEQAVTNKLREGQIHLGTPHLVKGERLLIIDDGCRFAITDDPAQ